MLVLAAASLSDAFAEIEVAFEQEHPGVDVEVSVAGSSALREQIEQGAPADVVAVANDLVMNELAGEGHVSDPIIFATNRLAVVTPTDAAGLVTSAERLADPDLLVGLCAPRVPCGQYALDALSMLGVEPDVDTYESDVRALTTKLVLGELDAGVIYSTDAARHVQDLTVVATLDGVDVRYPIAVLTDAPHSDDAADFVAFVLSPPGQAILASAGFEAP